VRDKTVTRSFRISEGVFLALEEEAKKRNISLNTLVNQLFLSYANFDRHFQTPGFLKMRDI
jgi:predicted HicB family RNase H-like nuclease